MTFTCSASFPSSPTSSTYWSVAFYDDDSNNYATIDNRSASADLQIVLTSVMAYHAPAPYAKDIIVPAETSQGVILIRILVPDPHHMAAQLAAEQSCRAQEVS